MAHGRPPVRGRRAGVATRTGRVVFVVIRQEHSWKRPPRPMWLRLGQKATSSPTVMFAMAGHLVGVRCRAWAVARANYSRTGLRRQNRLVVVGVLVLLFVTSVTIFAVRRSILMWRDRELFERTVAQSSFYPFRTDVRRGLERGWVPFSFGLLCLSLFLPIGLLSAANVVNPTRHPGWLVAGSSLLLLFVIGECLQLTVTWFNRPRWCVPPYLRAENGAWAERHPRKP